MPVIHTIDLQFQGVPGLIAGFLLQSGGDLALIETGPGSCQPALIAGLQALGIAPQDVRHVFVTHIHLDHSGGAGWWAQQGAQVYVHEKGAPHVVDPAKLISSAARIYGERMDTLWGPILPAPAERVTVLRDSETATVGDMVIQALDTPGHARHHLAFAVDGVCFTGDVAGVRLAGCDYLSVAAAPPQFEPEPYEASVDRLLAGGFKKLYLTHYGEVTDVEDHLRRYRQRIDEVYQNISQWMAEGAAGEELARRHAAFEREVSGLSDEEWSRYEVINGTAMCAGGIELFVTKAAR